MTRVQHWHARVTAQGKGVGRTTSCGAGAGPGVLVYFCRDAKSTCSRGTRSKGGVQGYIAHKKESSPWDHYRTLGIVLL